MASLEEKENMDSTPTPPSTSTFHHFRPSFLLLLNAALILLGAGGPVLLRLYFVHGGHRLWLSSFLQICGWPLLLLPLSLSGLLRHPTATAAAPRFRFSLSFPLFAASAVLGVLIGLDCYLYATSSSYLPLSTSSIIISSQLGFTAVFALLIVRQRFTPYSINAVVLLTLGPAVLGLGSGSDRPAGESSGKYYLGFLMAVAAVALMGLVLPLMELCYRKTKAEVTYALVMEMQLVMGVSGTAFCLAGMAIDNDFQVIAREAKEFGLGETKYYLVLIWDAIFWQFLNLGLLGLISTSSSLLGGIFIAILLPLGEILSVIFFKEKFNGGKGVALVLCLWGFVSYLYGEMKLHKKLKQSPETELPTPIP